jgi:alkylation response protein AidB-like acyl-CoA dehydrogenase
MLDELMLLRTTARDFLSARAPVERTRRNYEADAQVDRELWREMASLGWLTMSTDGAAEGVQALGVVAEELGRVVSDQPVLVANLVARALARWGSAEQRDRYLAPLAAGDLIATLDLGGYRSCLTEIHLEAATNPEGFRLAGSDILVERGDEADLVLVAAKLPGGIVAQFLVPAGTPGVRTTRLRAFDLGRRYASLAFDDVQLDAGAVLGGGLTGEYGEDAETQQLLATVLTCKEALGAATRAFEITFSHVQTRIAFGRIIGSYQAIKHRLTDMCLWLETSRAVTDAAVDALARGDSGAGELVSIAKAYLNEKTPLIGRDCVQLHGGIGFTWEHDLHLYMRRLEANALIHGDVDDHLLRIADVVMGDAGRTRSLRQAAAS